MPTMAGSMDTLSYLACQFGGTGNYTYIPMAMSSSVSDDPALQQIFLAANTGFQATNWVRGIWQPAVNVVTVAKTEWFNATTLHRAFTNRDANTGRLVYDMGPVGYDFGNQVTLDEIWHAFSKSYWSGMVISGGGAGGAITTTFGVLPCGVHLGTPPVNFNEPVGGYETIYHTDGVLMNNGSMTNILGWTLSINNGMSPDLALPVTPPAANSVFLIPDYIAGACRISLRLVQRTQSSGYTDASSANAINQIIIRLVDPTNSNPITFTCQFMKAVKTSSVSGDESIIVRDYMGQASLSLVGGNLLYVSPLSIS